MTVQSDIYRKKIHDLIPTYRWRAWPVPSLLPWLSQVPCQPVLPRRWSMKPCVPLVGKVDSLILGCTHYPLLRPIIQNVMGPKVQLIDSGAECVRDISVLLNYFEINRGRDAGPLHHRFLHNSQ